MTLFRPRIRRALVPLAGALALCAGSGAAFGVDAPAIVPGGAPTSPTTTLPAARAFATATPSGLARVLDELSARQRDLAGQVKALESSLLLVESQESSEAVRLDQLLAQEKELAKKLATAQDHLRHLDTTPTAAGRNQRADLERQARETKQELEAAHLRAVTQGAALTPAPPAPRLSTGQQGLDDARRQLADVTAALNAVAASEPLSPSGIQGVRPGPLALGDIPPEYLALYQRAAQTCSGLSWTVLAAIGSIESDHGRSNLPGVRSGANFAGAMGPMQFLADTWAVYRVDGDGDGLADVYRPADAVFGAARYLCSSGAGQPARLRDAIWAYNNADWYVNQVIDLAIRYGSTGLMVPPAPVIPADVLANPRIVLSADARADIQSGMVDRRVITLLAAAAVRHRIEVTVIRTGHAPFVRGTDRVSDHFYARAVDISAVDGVAVSATNRAAFDLAIEILTAAPSLRPDQLGSPWLELTAFAGAFSDDDHTHHLHLGWRANPPELR